MNDVDSGTGHDSESRTIRVGGGGGGSAVMGMAKTLQPNDGSGPEWHADNQGHCPDPVGAFVLGVTASVAARGLIR
jgi:hypothetical protein